jgi:hypothetical protein
VLASLPLALLTGRLIAVDAAPIVGLRVLVHWDRDTTALGATDTLTVSSDGRFGGLIRQTDSDSVWIVVRPRDDTTYYPARIALPRARLADSLHVLLVPRRWTIRDGRFAGRIVPIDLVAALRRVPGYGSFGRLSSNRVVGWMPGSFPLPLILRRDEGPRISTADSAAFWDAARDLEAAIGTPLFRPTGDTAMVGRIFPVDVFVDRRISGAGITFVTWDRDGQIFEASIRFRGTSFLRDREIVQHELMHALGFGHTSAWPSTLSTGGRLRRIVTEEDVAYARFLMRVHELEQDPLLVSGLVAR